MWQALELEDFWESVIFFKQAYQFYVICFPKF